MKVDVSVLVIRVCMVSMRIHVADYVQDETENVCLQTVTMTPEDHPVRHFWRCSINDYTCLLTLVALDRFLLGVLAVTRRQVSIESQWTKDSQL